MSSTIDLEQIDQQVNYLSAEIQTILVDVPGWITPVPTALAEATTARDALFIEWVDAEDAVQGTLHAIRSAQAADVTALKEAARSGKPLPRRKGDEDKLRRQAVYDLESAHQAYRRLSAANSTVKEALETVARDLVHQAVEVAKIELNTYATTLAEARRTASDASEAFARAVQPLIFVSHLESVRSNVQFNAGGDPNIRLEADHMAPAHVHATLKMLQERGLAGPATS